MAKIVATFNNFAQGQIDYDYQGRFDLLPYGTGLKLCKNFHTDFKGNLIYRSGFKLVDIFQSSCLYEFKFSNSQNYTIVAYDNKFRFLSADINGNFGWVLDGSSNILEVDTPYTGVCSTKLQTTQNRDVMTITHPSYYPRQLIRLSANSFKLEKIAIKGDPFFTLLDTSKTITGITNANPCVITSTAHGYANGDQVVIAGVVGMVEMNDYSVEVTVIDADSFSVNLDTSDTADWTAYVSGGIAKKVLTFDAPRCCLFYEGRKWFGSNAVNPTRIWGSEGGIYDNFVIPTTITDASPMRLTLTDISERIEWLYGGDNSLLAGAKDGIISINGGGVGTPITAETIRGKITSADPVNEVYPFSKDRFVFYVDKNGRKLHYFSYDLLNESFISRDANIISYDITLSAVKRIRSIREKYDLIFALLEDGRLLTCTFFNQGDEVIKGWHQHITEGKFIDIATTTTASGETKLLVVVERDGSFFIEQWADYVEFAHLQNFIGSNEATDFEKWYRYVSQQLTDSYYLDNSEIIQNLKSNSITFNPSTNRVVATSDVFVAGDVGKFIVYQNKTGVEIGRFEITSYVSVTEVGVKVITAPFNNTYVDWYLTFNSASGLTRFANKTISVVADGGYLGDYAVDGSGLLTLDRQVFKICIGYKYQGIAKSFPLGFVGEGKNTHATLKGFNRVTARFTLSSACSIGSNPYKLQSFEQLGREDLNYLPAVPMDETSFLTLSANFEIDTSFYIVQNTPAPMILNALMIEVETSVNN